MLNVFNLKAHSIMIITVKCYCKLLTAIFIYIYFSINDVASDFLTGFEYLLGHTFEKNVTNLNDSGVANVVNKYNVTIFSCSLMYESEGSYTFSCVEYHFWYGTLTFLFIFTPSTHVLAALLGPKLG